MLDRCVLVTSSSTRGTAYATEVETQDEAENAPAAAKGLEEELRTERRTPGQNEAQQQPVSSPVGSPYGTLLKLEFAFAASTHVGRRVCYRPTDEAEWRAARVLSYRTWAHMIMALRTFPVPPRVACRASRSVRNWRDVAYLSSWRGIPATLRI